jgi:hypothetical protein
MPQTSFSESFPVSRLRKIISAVATFLGPSWDGPRGAYQPHCHYMRGPGPKCREKHRRNNAFAAGSQSSRSDS